ncbi:MAG: hypothetical protein R6U36_08685 [Candidatus Fermentibacteraceae bacterium]
MRPLAVIALALMLACGGGDAGRRYVPAGGFVRIENIRTDLDRSTASLRNAPNPVHFAGVPMPATLRIQVYGGGSARSSVSFQIPCGPEGDFFAGREVVPASVVLETHGTTTFAPSGAYPGFRASLSANPLLADSVDYSLHALFSKGGVEYECSVSGRVPVTTGAAYDPGELPSYPPLEMGDSLFFSTPDSSYRVKAAAALVDSMPAGPMARLMLFPDSVPPSDLTKPRCTRLETWIPLSMVGGGPVPASFTCTVPGVDTLVLTADPRFGFLDVARSNGRLVGRMAFVDNGSRARTRFRGGGSFDLKLR